MIKFNCCIPYFYLISAILSGIIFDWCACNITTDSLMLADGDLINKMKRKNTEIITNQQKIKENTPGVHENVISSDNALSILHFLIKGIITSQNKTENVKYNNGISNKTETFIKRRIKRKAVIGQTDSEITSEEEQKKRRIIIKRPINMVSSEAEPEYHKSANKRLIKTASSDEEPENIKTRKKRPVKMTSSEEETENDKTVNKKSIKTPISNELESRFTTFKKLFKKASSEEEIEKPKFINKKLIKTANSNEDTENLRSIKKRPIKSESSEEKPNKSRNINKKVIKTSNSDEDIESSRFINKRPIKAETSEEDSENFRITNKKPIKIESSEEETANSRTINKKPIKIESSDEEPENYRYIKKRPTKIESSGEESERYTSINRRPFKTSLSNKKPRKLKLMDNSTALNTTLKGGTGNLTDITNISSNEGPQNLTFGNSNVTSNKESQNFTSTNLNITSNEGSQNITSVKDSSSKNVTLNEDAGNFTSLNGNLTENAIPNKNSSISTPETPQANDNITEDNDYVGNLTSPWKIKTENESETKEDISEIPKIKRKGNKKLKEATSNETLNDSKSKEEETKSDETEEEIEKSDKLKGAKVKPSKNKKTAKTKDSQEERKHSKYLNIDNLKSCPNNNQADYSKQQKPTWKDVTSEIEEMNVKISNSFNNLSWDIVDTFDKKITIFSIFLPKLLKSKPMIKQEIEKYCDKKVDLKLKTEEAYGDGELAFAAGKQTYNICGDKKSSWGRFIQIWKVIDGKYLLHEWASVNYKEDEEAKDIVKEEKKD